MDENWYKPTLPKPPATPPKPDALPDTPPERVVFAPRDWLALAMALICALIWFAVFGLDALMESLHLPGLGAAVFTLTLWAAVLIYLGRDAKWTPWNAGLAAGVAVLCLCCCVFGNVSVRLINFLLIACGSALCFFDLSGKARRALTDAMVILNDIGLTLWALFSGWGKPFKALGSLGKSDRRLARQILLGLLAAVPLLAVVLSLLIDADAVFGSIFSGFGQWLSRINAGSLIWKIVRTLAATLMFFSAIYFLRHAPSASAEEGKKISAPPAAFITVSGLLIAVYTVFAVIQFTFLFGGESTAAMEGGYAEYARNGFFQLVWVSVINLAVVLSCSVLSERRTLLNIMSTILLALTAVILFSAFWRMRLYILAYGMSILRAMTLWAMAFIAVSLVLAGLRIWRPGFRFWPLFAAVGLAGWCLFNVINIDARVADWNVDAYLDGRLETVDICYLSGLSPDVLPALERLREAEGGDFTGHAESDLYLYCTLDDAIDDVDRYFVCDSWRDWCWSYFSR